MNEDPNAAYRRWARGASFWPVLAAGLCGALAWHALEEPEDPFFQFIHDYLNLPVIAAFGLAMAWNRSQAVALHRVKTKLAKVYNRAPELHDDDIRSWFARNPEYRDCRFTPEEQAEYERLLRARCAASSRN